MTAEKRALRRFAGLLIGGGLHQAGYSAVTTIIGPFLNSRGISAEQLGVLNSLNWAVVTLASMPAGRLSDTLGRSLPFVISAVAASLGWAALFLRTDMVVASIAFLSVGLSVALFTPTSTALISESFSDKTAPIFFAIFYLVAWGGAAVASVVAGSMSESIAPESPLLLASTLHILSGVALILALRSSRSANPTQHGRGIREVLSAVDVKGIVSTVRENPLLAFYGFSIFFHTFGFLMITPFLSLYLEKVVGLDMVGVGLVMAAWNAGLMVGLLPWAWVSTKKGSEVVLVAHFLLSAVVWLAVTLSRDLVCSMAIMFLFGIAGSMDLPARRTLTADLSSRNKLAEATGFVELVTGIGGLSGSLLGGLLWERLGPAFPFYIGPVMTLVSVPPMLKLAARVRNESKGSETARSSGAT